MNDTTVVVTGASRGIGRAVTERFGTAGAHVVCCARDRDAVDDVAATLREGGASVTAIRADVRDEFDVERLIQQAVREAGPIDVVVANAGVYHGDAGETPLADESYSAFDDHLRTNARGVFVTIREAVPHLSEDPRVLVPVGPFGEQMPPGYGSYAVSKAASDAVARTFAAELDVPVGRLDPGKTATDLTGSDGHDPADAAEMCHWAVTDLAPDDLDGELLTRADWRRATR
jgi:NAD(P)-dependent dehydrogenase (short-subunit alcohol dehydrogenase family)